MGLLSEEIQQQKAGSQPASFFLFPEMLAATGRRSIGIEAAQLIALANRAHTKWQAPSLRLETSGIRGQVEAVVASALEPHLFGEVAVHGGMHSLSYLLSKPVSYEDAPDLFCLDFFKEFDLDRLAGLAEPTRVRAEYFVEELPTP